MSAQHSFVQMFPFFNLVLNVLDKKQQISSLTGFILFTNTNGDEFYF